VVAAEEAEGEGGDAEDDVEGEAAVLEGEGAVHAEDAGDGAGCEDTDGFIEKGLKSTRN
jgi:hypothetical protein